jgi:hypothetical protein
MALVALNAWGLARATKVTNGTTTGIY